MAGKVARPVASNQVQMKHQAPRMYAMTPARPNITPTFKMPAQTLGKATTISMSASSNYGMSSSNIPAKMTQMSAGSSYRGFGQPIAQPTSNFKQASSRANVSMMMGSNHMQHAAFTVTHNTSRAQTRTFAMAGDGETADMPKFDATKIATSLIREPTAEEAEKYKGLPTLSISLMDAQFLQTISEGWASPLDRFMNEQELLESMNMNTVPGKDGQKHILSVPIVLSLTEAQKAEFEGKEHIALKCGEVSDDVLAVISNPEFFPNRKEEICTKTFGTRSVKHPMIENIEQQGDWLISGESMHFCKRITYNDGLDKYRMLPAEIAKVAEERGADAVYAFQVRNPLHNGHCLLLKDTREQLIKKGYKNPLLLLHPLGGWLKDDDVPLAYRMRQHQALLDDGTLVPEHTILAIWPSPMFYSGPNEVLWHASSRKEAGITHFITGRDPAGVKHPELDDDDLYDHWHGQKLLVSQKALLNGVDILPFKIAAYREKNKQMEFFGVPGGPPKDEFTFISGSKMRKLAAAGQEPPEGFMSPAGWEAFSAYYQDMAKKE